MQQSQQPATPKAQLEPWEINCIDAILKTNGIAPTDKESVMRVINNFKKDNAFVKKQSFVIPGSVEE